MASANAGVIVDQDWVGLNSEMPLTAGRRIGQAWPAPCCNDVSDSDDRHGI